MADKDSREDSDGGAETHGVAGARRSPDSPNWDVPTTAQPAAEARATAQETDDAFATNELPEETSPANASGPPEMLFVRDTASEPDAPSLRTHVTLLPHPPEPAITAAVHDLFYPRPGDTSPAYRPHSPPMDERQPEPPADTRPPLEAPAGPDRKADIVRRLKIFARYAAYAVLGYLGLVLVLILAFRFINPPGSALMLFRLLTGTSIDRTWVPIENISPALVRAVVVAEDGRFCEHAGIDFIAIQEAIQHSNDAIPRGASTISMQVVKNMFLWNAKSYVRKVIEMPLTLIMELVWPKRRILEVYLNIAEWGPGVFGAEAAARHHFRKPASRLGEREASLLAASLPNPVVRDAGDPGPQTSRKARVVQARMRAAGPAVTACTGIGR